MMRAAFDRRGRTMYEMLNAIPGVTAIEPQGAFYGFPSFEGVLGRTIRGRTPDSTAAARRAAARRGQGRDRPGEAFGAPGYARLSFALGDDDIVEGITRIAKLLTE